MRFRSGLIGASAAISLGLLWLTEVPLGVPGEWTWNRISSADSPLETWLGIAAACIFGTIYVAVAWLGLRRISLAGRAERCGWLLGLGVAAFAWMLAVQESPPDGYRMSKAPWVLYYPGMTGYFFKARYEINDTSHFIAEYQHLMAEGDVLHLGTHPPGMFLLYRGLLGLTDAVPGLVPLLNATQPDSVVKACDVIEQGGLQSGRDFGDQDRAVLWLGALLGHASVVLAMLALWRLLRLSESRESAWKSICFWPLVPAVLIFLPKCDVLFTGLVATFVCCWLLAVRSRSLLLGVLAGFLGWLGLCLSLVFLPIGLVALLAGVLWLAFVDRAQSGNSLQRVLKQVARQSWRPIVGGGLMVVGLIVASGSWLELNLVAVWKLNLANHAGFYAQYVRTKWLWLLVNPIELVLSLGAPVAVIAMLGVARAWRLRGQSNHAAESAEPAAHWLRHAGAVAVSVVWGLLWLSGKNSGEAARLWIPLMPFAVWVLPSGWSRETTDDDDSVSDHEWLTLLVLQAGTCLLTVARVTGFHF